jgi:hypothetical protein
MRELEDEIVLLQLRSEQVLIHLQHLQPGSSEAIVARAELDAMVQRLGMAQGKRDRLLREITSAAGQA